MSEQLSHEEKRERLYELIKKNDVAMMTTLSNDKLVSRPMSYQEAEEDGNLWFITMRDTEKADELLADPRVNIAFSKEGYISISGTARLVDDLELKKKYWNKAMDAFLNTTYDDPNVVLIKVEADSAEYWGTDQKAKTFVEGLKRLVSTDRTNDSETNQTLDL
ncbi:pyridoxamine 5'-phosphate oxidase family protein [Macrococcus equipercicus]|uniref:Pyridoxamine 5'-phosphate oxidase family protein n=1 Tax=Macrococcus equipercicus TaxID=69967 RepID=A0A9Q9BWS3_9STAP|nr:pyridoxamine 5'-phosphate oxidase family protein [Macrococcus equipercicus]UTH13927.1 pyridoxamine 5'-phosphate oxidase family protein [Macrococcus equipercicus]